MIPGFERIIEEKIRRAQKDGAFENLQGSGRPMKEEDVRIPADLRMAYHLLKTADMLPPELETRKEILSTRELLSAATDLDEQYRLLTRLNLLIRKANSSRTGNPALDLPEGYAPAVLARLAATTGSKPTDNGSES